MLGRAWFFALFCFSSTLYGFGYHSGPYPLSFRSSELSNCGNRLLEAVVKKRFSGETGSVNFAPPGALRFGQGLDEFLRAAQVPENYVHLIGALMARLLMSDWEGDSMLRDPMRVLQNESARRGLTIYLLSGCTGKHDGLYVCPQRDFELASLFHPEFASREDEEFRVLLASHAPTYPPMIIASTQLLIPSDNPSEEEERAIQWVGVLFHELKHHTNRKLISDYIKARLWRRNQGRSGEGWPTDTLFRYVNHEGRVPRPERGVFTIFEESTSENATFRVIAKALEQSDWERTRTVLAKAQVDHARIKVEAIREGTYGRSAARFLEEGIDLPDHMGPINESNFFLVGAMMQEQMAATVARYEQEMGVILPTPERLPVPSYNVTPLIASPSSDTVP